MAPSSPPRARPSSPPPAAAPPSPASPRRPTFSRSTSAQSATSIRSSHSVHSHHSHSSQAHSPTPPKSPTTTIAPKTDDIIDMDIFAQILELDEGDPAREFSNSMVDDYFEQVDSTFIKMDDTFTEKNLEELASLGHFLKGSSAALGVRKVQISCEEIQYIGQKLRDDKHDKELTKAEALALIGSILARVKLEYEEAQTWLKSFFAE